MAARIAGALGMQITELFAPSGDASDTERPAE
jgi:hypothetical protein